VSHTLSYRGQITSPLNVSLLTSELVEIAETLGWRWEEAEGDWSTPPTAELVHAGTQKAVVGHLGLRGVTLYPETIDGPLHFLFDSKGWLRSPHLVAKIRAGEKDAASAFVSVRVDLTTRRIYATVIHLLQYIKVRFIPKLDVLDPTGFWETNNDDALDLLSSDGLSPGEGEQEQSASRYEPSRFVSSELLSLVEKIIQRKMDSLN